jgi:hypothetical protein
VGEGITGANNKLSSVRGSLSKQIARGEKPSSGALAVWDGK